MKQKLNQGFTLIELLVVIAIIGILASVVLASLNTARDKGTDAANKSSVNNMRAQAELFYDTNGNYTNVCADPTIANAVANAGAVCDDDDTDYGISVNLLDPSGDAYCVDSSGASEENTVAAVTEISNDGSDVVCDGA